MKISITDKATPALRALMQQLQRSKVNAALGRGLQTKVRNHLFKYNRAHPNKLGGKRTNYYSQAGKATHWKETGKGIVVYIAHVGINQTVYGGVIKPGRNSSSKGGGATKFLTIPVAAEAHGKRASEFDDLELVFNRQGKPVALGRPGVKKAPPAKKGQRGARRKKGKALRATWNILFVLRRSVNQKPRPDVIPSEKVLVTEAHKIIQMLIKRTR